MSVKAEVLKEEFEFIFARLEETLEGTDDKEFNYRLTEVSNNIQMILNHMSRETNLYIPRIIKWDFGYAPEGQPDDYVEHSYGLEKLMADIKRGGERVLEGVARLSDEQLEEEMPLTAGPNRARWGYTPALKNSSIAGGRSPKGTTPTALEEAPSAQPIIIVCLP